MPVKYAPYIKAAGNNSPCGLKKNSVSERLMQSQIKKNSGAVLVVSLVILVVITVIGVSTIQTATLEEKMVAGARDRDLAFQAAEAALSAAEDRIENLANFDAFNISSCSGGLCPKLSYTDTKEPWKSEKFCSGNTASIWSCDASTEVDIDGGTAGKAVGFDALPRYYIEMFSEYEPLGDNINVTNIGDSIFNTKVTVFRITAIGYGGSDKSQVILQSNYGRER
ncbi:type IV pilus assembly protein PilX [Alteromonadaceae bacterium Bs31]|nr:type IV pilus assembly protein PilX [Alteromonadaceae bacterium Bs31]